MSATAAQRLTERHLSEQVLHTRSTHQFALVTGHRTEDPKIAGYAASKGPAVVKRAARISALILPIEQTGKSLNRVVVPARTVKVWSS